MKGLLRFNICGGLSLWQKKGETEKEQVDELINELKKLSFDKEGNAQKNKMDGRCKMTEKERINFCKAFADKIADIHGFENKVRYLLEDFFFEEGWASKTNKTAMKKGFTQQYTYNYSTIRHFIEDFVRCSEKEMKEMLDNERKRGYGKRKKIKKK